MPKSTKIPQVRFNLKSSQDKTSPRLIRAVYRFHGKKLVYSTQHKIRQNLWDKKKQFPFTYADHYNQYKKDLDAISKEITDYYGSLSESKQKSLTVEAFRDHLDRHFGRIQETDTGNSFFDYLDRIIKKKSRIDTSTVDKYKATKEHLLKYQTHIGQEINFDSFDWSFKDEFAQYLYDHTKVSSVNTVAKYIKIIKTTLKEAYRDKKHNNMIFSDRDWIFSPIKYKKVTLTQDEIDKLAQKDLSKNEKLSRARDLFLIALYTGLRYSDFINIKPENEVILEGERCLEVFTQKTNEVVYIPYTDELSKVLSKYGNKSPDPISSQRLNEYIKDVCQLAEINDPVIYQYNENGRTKQKTAKKYERITSHVGRRSFATINYQKGFPIVLLRTVTGHKSDSQFLDYVNVDKKKAAVELIKRMKKHKAENQVAKVVNL